jgi:hypothetical protein
LRRGARFAAGRAPAPRKRTDCARHVGCKSAEQWPRERALSARAAAWRTSSVRTASAEVHRCVA